MIEEYNRLQEHIELPEEIAESTLRQAKEYVKAAKKSRRLHITKFAAALTAAACILATVTVVPAAIHYVAKEWDKLTAYISANKIEPQFVNYPGISETIYNVSVSVDRYIRMEDGTLIEITMKNLDNQTDKKYRYDVIFCNAGEEEPKNNDVAGTLLDTVYSADDNSVSLTYLIQDCPDRLQIIPVSGESGSAFYEARREHPIYLNVSDAQIFSAKKDGVQIEIKPEDFGENDRFLPYYSNYPDFSYTYVPLTMTVSEFGVMFRYDYNQDDGRASDDFAENNDENSIPEHLWTPSAITLKYQDGSYSILFTQHNSDDCYSASFRRNGHIISCSGRTVNYIYANEEKDAPVVSQIMYYRASELVDCNNVVSVLVDNVEYPVRN